MSDAAAEREERWANCLQGSQLSAKCWAEFPSFRPPGQLSAQETIRAQLGDKRAPNVFRCSRQIALCCCLGRSEKHRRRS